MIVKSPLKKKKVRPNFRKGPAGAGSNGTDTSGVRNGSSDGSSYGRHINGKAKKKRMSLPNLRPWKVILGAFVVGALGVLYINHVFTTQELLREVQQLEREYNQVRRVNADYRLTYDRMIGPAEIYKKAKELGFINGGPAEKVIEVEEQ